MLASSKHSLPDLSALNLNMESYSQKARLLL